MAKTKALEPTYSINIFKHENNWYTGQFLMNGQVVFDTGIPNSYAFVYARLEPWFSQAPHTVAPKEQA